MNDTQTYILAALAILVVILVSYNFGLSSAPSTNYVTPNTLIVEPEPIEWIWWNPRTWYPWWYGGGTSGGSYYRPPHHRPPPHDEPPHLPRPPHNSQPPHLSNPQHTRGISPSMPTAHLPTISGSGGNVTGGHHERFTSGTGHISKNPFIFESIAMEHALPTSQSLPPSSRALKITNNFQPDPYISNSKYHLF